MKLRYTTIDHWPVLAWLARCDRSANTAETEVLHGSQVETQPEWFAEAVWDDNFLDGDFDRTDNVFGSGARLRDHALTFVSSSTTVDRLHSLETEDSVWVSNSLACLAAAVDARFDPKYPRYFADFETVIQGIREYRRTIATSCGPIRLTYYNNIQWSDGRLVETEKPLPQRDLASFDSYRSYAASVVGKLADNMTSKSRSHRYEMIGTTSTGYDSPTTAVLAREAGMKQTISFTHSRDHESDSGARIARRLGLEPIEIDSDSWRSGDFPEIPFIASDAKGEDVYFSGAEDVLRGRVLITAFRGSRIWGKGPFPDGPGDDLERADQCGLSLSEYRLRAGFVHCPLTFVGARQENQLQTVSRSPEMAAWDVPGDYSRPIARRIVEEAGVPREWFGQQKKATSVLFFDTNTFLTPDSLAEYKHWLSQHVPETDHLHGARFNGKSVAHRVSSASRRLARATQAVAGACSFIDPTGFSKRVSRSGRLAEFANYEPLFAYLFPWALERAKERYNEKPFALNESNEAIPSHDVVSAVNL